MDGQKISKNPKHFFTWSATAANNRIQKMSKTFANNITRLHLKMEKAIPFQQSVKVENCESLKTCDTDDPCNNNGVLLCPDVFNLSLKQHSSGSSCCSARNIDTSVGASEIKLANKVEERCEPKIQSARIVQSHPSVSQSHSQGSVANPDKIMQINLESYNAFTQEHFDSQGVKVSSVQELRIKREASKWLKKSDKILDMQSLELSYNGHDSGTGSANTSIIGSSLSSPSVSDSSESRIAWSRATEVSVPSPNLNSSSPFMVECGHDNFKGKSSSPNNIKKRSDNKFSLLLQESSNNSTNSGVSISESDETTLLIETNNNNKSLRKRGGGKKNVDIFNKKNSVLNSGESIGSFTTTNTPLRLKHLNSQSYPPSKLAVTILEEEEDLRNSPWFSSCLLPREVALEILRSESIGSFIVRESTTKSGCFALSLRVPNEYQPCGIAHFLIIKTIRGFKIKGFTKEFGSLGSLIIHHSILSELLPCTLSLPSRRVSRSSDSSDFMEHKLIIGTFTDF